jgi:hypothetical protein
MSNANLRGLAAIRAAIGSSASGSGDVTLSADDLRVALSDARAEGRAEGVAAGEEAGRVALHAERTRIGAIVALEEAKGREKLANHLAFNTSMSVDEAKAALSLAAASTDAPAADTRSELERRMEGTNPKVGADTGNEGAGQYGMSGGDLATIASRNMAKLIGKAA